MLSSKAIVDDKFNPQHKNNSCCRVILGANRRFSGQMGRLPCTMIREDDGLYQSSASGYKLEVVTRLWESEIEFISFHWKLTSFLPSVLWPGFV